GDRRDEVPARDVVLRGERRPALVERCLLRHRRPAERAAYDHAPKGARLAAELARDERAVVLHASMMLAPGGDAADDEKPLAGLHEPEPPRLTDELLPRAGLGEALLEACLLRPQRAHVRLPRIERVLR